jgi:pimeloyl-ACP methyl ester carboxylesterase
MKLAIQTAARSLPSVGTLALCLAAVAGCDRGPAPETPAATAAPALAHKVRGESQMVKLADANIEYFSQGQGDVVVLLPGGSLSVNYMEGLAQALADSELRAVRINPREAGKSTGAAKGVTLHDLAGDVAGVIKSLDVGAVNVAGHAFGNRVARMLAADHPELVKTVILFAAGGKVSPKPEVQKALQVIFAPNTTDAEYFAAMKYMVGDPANVKMAGEIIMQSRAPEAAPIEYETVATAKLADWWAPPGKARYLVLQGTLDQAAPPENGELLKKDLGDRLTLVPFPGAGHLMLVTEPKKAAAEVVRFLKSQELKEGNPAQPG